MGVVQRRRELGLGAEAAQEGGVLGQGRVQHFHRDAAAQAGVLGGVHPAARTGTDRAVQEVAAREYTTREIADSTAGHALTVVAGVRSAAGTHPGVPVPWHVA